MNNFLKWLDTYKPIHSRRFLISVLGIICLTTLGLVKGMSVSEWIATICLGISAANAYQKKEPENKTDETKDESIK